MKRLLLAAATALATAMVAMPTTAAHAEVDPNCYVQFTVPTELALRHPIRAIPYKVDTSKCTDILANYTYSVNGGDEIEFISGSVDTNEIDKDPYLIDNMRLGDWVWKGDIFSEASYDYKGTSNTSTTDVRVGSSIALDIRTSGARVTASVSATRYWTSTHDTGVFAEAVGDIQYRTSPTSPWQGYESFATDDAGRFTRTAPAPDNGTLQYRAVLDDSVYIWGDTSGTVTGNGSAGSLDTHPSPAETAAPNASHCVFRPATRGVIAAPRENLPYSYTSTDPEDGCSSEDVVSYAFGPSGTYTHSAFVQYFDLPVNQPYSSATTRRVPTLTDTMPLGVWNWRDDNDPNATMPHTDVRTGSVGYLTGTRSGSTVTLTAHASAFWTSLHKFSYRSGAIGQLQYFDPTTNTWKALKNITGDARGYSTWTGTVTPTRYFRVVYPDTTYTWGAISAVAKV